MHRRPVLAALATGIASAAGCTATSPAPGRTGTQTTSETNTPASLPDDCPTSQNLGVEWPRNLDVQSVGAFVEAYEHVYYRDIVVDYESDSRLSSYQLSGSVSDTPTAVDGGWVLEYSGSGGVYNATLYLRATVTEPPENADLVLVAEFERGPVIETLETAVDAGEAEYHVEEHGEPVERYIDRFASLSTDFRRLSGPGEEDTLYVDVNGTTVELTAQTTNFHGDYWWNVWYYVDEHVVRRTTGAGADPLSGTLLECRTLNDDGSE